MEKIDASKLVLWSFGRAAENKAYGSRKLRVSPLEKRPRVDGEVSSGATRTEVKGTDSTGQEYHSATISSNDLEATWLPWGEPNRCFAPDINRGGLVTIYRYAEREYYWVKGGIGEKDAFCTFETAVYAWAAKEDHDAPLTGENSYVGKVDTRNKLVSFTTSTAAGEKTPWNLSWNTDVGQFQLSNGGGDQFAIDVVKKRIAMMTGGNALNELVGPNQNDRLPGNYTAAIDGGWTVAVKGKVLLTSDTGMQFAAPTMTLDSDVTITKGLKVGANLAIGGTTKADGIMVAPDFQRG